MASGFPRRPWWATGWLGTGLTVIAVLLLASGQDELSGAWLLAVVVVAVIAALSVAGARWSDAQRRRFEDALAAAAAREAVQSDRIVIARDLHDIVSHGLGAIVLRARAGLRAGTSHSDDARAALQDVIDLGRSATDDLRRLLGVLHDPEAAAPTVPTPGLAEVAGLVDAARRRGVSVTATGLEARADTPGTELVAYHVVREALANTERHAGPTSVAVSLSSEPEGGLRVQVTDTGPVAGWVPQPGAGHGLVLLRHRVEAHGGTLTSGPEGSGFRLAAVLPGGAS